MTTITLEFPTPTGRLEELVDRLLAALFLPEPSRQEPAASIARTIHEARRLRQSGDLDGALAVFAGLDRTIATEAEARWLYSEWLDIARRRFADCGAMVYSPASGTAAGAGSSRLRGNDATSRGSPGDALAGGQDGFPAQPAGVEAPGERGCVMVVAHTTVDIAELKARNPLGDTVEAAGIALRGKGRVRQGVCPFHQEVEGSFTVYADSEKFYCFGCGAGGDVLDFVGRMEGLTLPEAIRRLDDTAGTAPVAARRPAPTPRSSPPPLPPRDPALLTAAVRFYAGELRRSPGARAYLASRGVGLDAAMRLGLGYAEGNGLRQYLDSLGFNPDRQRASGLFLEQGAERFAGMVTVPDIANGRVRWLTGRAVDASAKPRFQAVPGPKPVLGLGRLGPTPPLVVLTEGVFDYLALAGWGLPACAALGTQGLDKVAAALGGCPRVFLAFDNDGAGAAAAESLRELLGRRAAVVYLLQGVADVGELTAHHYGKVLFHKLLQRAAHAAR